jgi:DNA repair protein RadD
MFELRKYQQEAVNSVLSHIKKSATPCLIELATGAGKSLIIAELAKQIHKMSNKSILCIAPSAELVTQNRGKYLLTGEPASLFSASVGIKCLRHPVVFGTPQSIKNSIEHFGDRFAAIIIDEAHGITPSLKDIIEHLRNKNKNVRILGMTATPYRMGTGYIYRQDVNGRLLNEDKTQNPYFDKLLYSVKANKLIKDGYLTQPIIGQIGDGVEKYETSTLQMNNRGMFDIKDVERVFEGQGRKTAEIVKDIVGHSVNRQGVIIFGATIQHANEIMESLPRESSALITGKTPKKERESILKQFQNKRIKYLVNVAVLTTGFDAVHIDVVALMRATESAGLMQQIIGRGLRLDDGKEDCLILDYAENIDRHTPDGDLFSPQIKVKTKKEGGETMDMVCPTCNNVNEFKLRENKDGYKIDEEGYFTDLLNKRVETENGFIPAHYGRRCQALISTPINPSGIQCGHRWNSKECPHCNADNDIAARHCTTCRGEIIDPNEKLHLEFKVIKKDPYQKQIDEVLDMTVLDTMSQAGNPCLRVKFVTPYRTFEIWLQKEAKNERALRDYNLFKSIVNFESVTYNKEVSGFYRVLAYNQEVQKDESR